MSDVLTLMCARILSKGKYELALLGVQAHFERVCIDCKTNSVKGLSDFYLADSSCSENAISSAHQAVIESDETCASTSIRRVIQ